MLSRITLFLFVLSLAIGCASTVPPPTSTDAAAVSAASASPAPEIPVVSVIARTDPDTLHPNNTLTLNLELKPWLFSRQQTASGIATSRLQADANSPVHEMRFCFQFDTACSPNSDWLPYQQTYSTTLPVDWLGKRDLIIFAEFRDANGNNIPTAQALQKADHPLTYTLTLHSILDERTPDASQPAFVQTAVSATRTAFPVSGSLEIQNGMCCAGGKVPSNITLTAAFTAASAQGTVTEMRTLNRCATPQEMESAAWEPFVAQKTYPYQITVANFVGWYLAVQYRDNQGNLSPVYCDDISIEGMP